MFVVDSLYCDVNSASAKSFILKAGFIIIIFLSLTILIQKLHHMFFLKVNVRCINLILKRREPFTVEIALHILQKLN